MKFNFTDYLNTRLDEKLGNLNASNDSTYKFLLKATLKNNQWRGDLVGPGSKIVTLSGRGRANFIKDLSDIQKKMDVPQLIFLTTEFKTVMIKNEDPEKYDERLNTFVANPINANLQTADIIVASVNSWDLKNGPVLPKAEIENYVVSAKGNSVIRRLKNSLDNAALGDDTDYHAIVILPDIENINKKQQRITNRYNNSGDKYAVIRNGNTRFMDQAKNDAETLRLERSAKSYNSRTMTFEDLYDILGNTNDRVIIDNDLYTKGFYDKISGHGYKFTITSRGVIHVCKLSDSTGKWRLLTYNINLQRFIIE